MKILIATGIFPPQIGGMATIVETLAKGLTARAHEVRVVTYVDEESGIRNQELGIMVAGIVRGNSRLGNYFRYFREVLKHGKDMDIIFAQDLGSSGIPAWLASFFLNGKLVLRLGGDFLWEKQVEKHGVFAPFEKYYLESKKGIANLYLAVFHWILHAAKLVMFNSHFQADAYKKHFLLTEAKVKILPNPIEVKIGGAHTGNLIFAGRFIRLKNIETLLRVFSKIQTDKKLILVGAGHGLSVYKKIIEEQNLGHRVEIRDLHSKPELEKLISLAYLAVIPSLTEMNPNFVAEALGLGTPVLITKHNGLPEQVKSKLFSFDPLSEQDLTAKLEQLLKPEIYRDYLQKLSRIDFRYTKEQMVSDCANFLEQVL